MTLQVGWLQAAAIGLRQVERRDLARLGQQADRRQFGRGRRAGREQVPAGEQAQAGRQRDYQDDDDAATEHGGLRGGGHDTGRL